MSAAAKPIRQKLLAAARSHTNGWWIAEILCALFGLGGLGVGLWAVAVVTL